MRGPKRVEVLAHRCIECTTCIGACPTGALALPEANGQAAINPQEVLFLPEAMLAQFGAAHSPAQVRSAAARLGFAGIVALTIWEQALTEALAQRAAAQGARPVISPGCPAVVQLIESRFPALLPNLAPLYSAPEAALRQHADQAVVLITLCPAQRSAALTVNHRNRLRFMTPGAVRSMMHELLARGTGRGGGEDQTVSESAASRDRKVATVPEGLLRVTGIRHVREILEEIESGAVPDVVVLELYACDQGCRGSALVWENPFIAEYRNRRLPDTGAAAHEPQAAELTRTQSFRPRPGIRVDSHLPTAMLKLGDIGRLARRLPGSDCGLCGSPSCEAFAEDVVLGRCQVTACSERSDREENPS